MTRTKSFITATARRRKNPVIWDIDDKLICLRAEAEILEVADLAALLEEEIPKDQNQVEGLKERKEIMLNVIRTFVDPQSIEAFNELAPDLEFTLLVEMCHELKAEYSGESNPTQEQLSSDKSSDIGKSSTDIAPLEGLTPPVSPPIEQ